MDSWWKSVIRTYAHVLVGAVLLLAGTATWVDAARAEPPTRIDTTYAVDGRDEWNPDFGKPTRTVKILADSSGGSLAVTTINSKFGLPSMSVVRRTTAGTIDTTFGTAGWTVPIDGYSAMSGLLLGNGKFIILAVGDNWTNQSDISLFRFTATGILDTSFATNGMATFQAPGDSRWMGTSSDDIYDWRQGVVGNGRILQQSNGRLVIAATAFNGNSTDIDWWNSRVELIGVNPTGTLDTSFGTNGREWIKYPTGTSSPVLADAVVDSSNRIVVSATDYVGSGSSYVLAARRLADGTADVSFDGDSGIDNGYVQVNIGLTRTAGALITVGTKYIISGFDEMNRTFLMKLNADGSADGSFGWHGLKDGIVTTRAPRTLISLPNGDLVVLASCVVATCLFRLHSDGSYGSWANGSTYVDVSTGWEDATIYPMDMVRRTDGQLLVSTQLTGTNGTFISENAELRSIGDTSGVVDDSFDGQGQNGLYLSGSSGYMSKCESSTSTSGFTVIACLWRPLFRDLGLTVVAIAKYDYLGNRESLGGDGRRYFVLEDQAFELDIRGVAVNFDTSAYIVMRATDNNNASWVEVLRLDVYGNPDTNFSNIGRDGEMRIFSDANDASPEKVALAPDGDLLIAGYLMKLADPTNAASGFGQGVVYRINPDATLDDSFDGDAGNGNGIVPANGGGTDSYNSYIAVDSLGRIVVEGRDSLGSYVARLLPDGSYDMSFNGLGMRTLHSADVDPTGDLWVRGVTVDQTSNAVTATAVLTRSDGTASPVLFRFTAAGALDQSFDGDFGAGNGRIVYPVANGETDVMIPWIEYDGGKLIMLFSANDGSHLEYLDQTGHRLNLGSNGQALALGSDFVMSMTHSPFGWWGIGKAGYEGESYVFRLTAEPVTTTTATTTTTTPTTTSTPAPPTTTPTTTTSSSTTIASTTTTIASTTTTTPVVTPTTTVVPVVAQRSQPAFSTKKALSARSIAAYVGLSVPKGARLSLTVSTSSKKICTAKGSILKAVKTGTCSVTVSVTFVVKKKPSTTKKKVSLKAG